MDDYVYSLMRVRTGKELSPILAMAEAYLDDYPELNAMTSEPVKMFLSTVHDMGEIWDDMGPDNRIDAEKQLTDSISVLDELGIHVYARLHQRSMRSPTGPWKMNVVVLFLNEVDAEEISSQIHIA